MRLYVNDNEVEILKLALDQAMTGDIDLKDFGKLNNLRERVELCEALQKNTNKAKLNGERSPVNMG